ncbi:MAG TPA: hypothetical protein VHQ65_11785 [Thermoanaerobaculia bacterium]|nr:hypothetical protein [Thermoanaerobaculia bacterium]
MTIRPLRKLALILGVLLASPFALPMAADDVVPGASFDRTFPAIGVRLLHLDLPVGELTVRAASGDSVRIEGEVRCDAKDSARCRDTARRLALGSSAEGDRLAVWIEGWPRNRHDGLSVALAVTLPARLALSADVGVGEVAVEGIAAVRIDLGVGEVQVIAAQRAVGRVNVDVGVGDATLHTAQRSIEGKGFLGKELVWRQGTGRSTIAVDCGVGEVEIHLE